MALYSSSTGGAPARPLVAELVGTFILVFVGCSVAVAGALQRPIAGPRMTRWLSRWVLASP